MEGPVKYTPIESEVDELLRKAVLYIQSYRTIEAQNVLNKALRLVESNKEVRWQPKFVTYRNLGDSYVQMGNIDEGIRYFIKSYEVNQDGNVKAAAANTVASYFLMKGDNIQAKFYADKAQETAEVPELLSRFYQIYGAIALAESDHQKALEQMNKAAELAENAQVPSPDFYDEGRYNFVADERNRNIVHLMPTSQSPFTLYRGQSRYYDPCLPSLYRGDPSEEDVVGNRLKICEFALLLDTHPVFQEIGRNLMVEPIALAQHYGLTTECLDITNSKWVAAFFACTDYDYDTDTYTPVGSDFKEGYGVMYITKEWVLKEKPMEYYEKYGVIGFQYFDRPTKQSSFGIKLSRDEDFNKSPYFDKIFFRHDLAASTMVYNMSYQQNRFIPRDPLSKLARTISESKEITRRAHYLCWNRFYADKSPGFLEH